MKPLGPCAVIKCTEKGFHRVTTIGSEGRPDTVVMLCSNHFGMYREDHRKTRPAIADWVANKNKGG